MQFLKGITGILLLLFVVSACAGIRLEQVDKKIREAESSLERAKGSAKNIDVKEALYPLEIAKSEEKLKEANLLKKYDKKIANSAAEESIKFSEQALKRITIDQGIKEAEKVKKYVQEKEEYSSLKDLLIKLDHILDYAKGLEDGIKSFSPVEAAKNMEELGKIKETIKKHIFAKIESDVSFDVGKYTISKREGKQALDVIVSDVLTKKKEFINKFPNSTMLINIKTVGYTDTQPLRSDTQLGKRCGGNGNQCLSELRAETIAEYIAQGVSKIDPSVKIKKDPFGKGEELPVGVTEPYPANDSRRRICIVDIAIGNAE